MNRSVPSRWFGIKERFIACSIDALFRAVLALILGTLLTLILCLAYGEVRWEYFFGGYVGAILIVWGIAFWLALSFIL